MGSGSQRCLPGGGLHQDQNPSNGHNNHRDHEHNHPLRRRNYHDLLLLLLAVFAFLLQPASAAPRVTGITPNNGPQAGGTRVSITGTDLGDNQNDVLRITIAGSPCNDRFWASRFNLECTTGPAMAQNRGPVIVTTRSGGEGTSAIEYSYNLAPYISDLSPNNGPVGGGTRVTIRGNALGQNRADIISVTVANVSCESIIYNSTVQFSCVTGSSPRAGRGVVSMVTTSGGASTSDAFYTYNDAPEATLIAPSSGTPYGGQRVEIEGRFLGKNESDVVDVVVAGVSCFNTLEYVSSTKIACITGMFPHPENPFEGEVYVITASGGSGELGNEASTKYRYNAAPSIHGIFPQNGPVTGFTWVQINGAHLGLDADDLEDIFIAGVSCTYSKRWSSPNVTSCVTAQAVTATTGVVELRTKSGGDSITSVHFTYKPACYLHTSEAICKAEQCSWCKTSSSCLGDVVSCPSDCNSFSCASLLIVFLIVGFIFLLIPITVLIARQVTREAQLKSQVRSFYQKMTRKRTAEKLLEE